MRCSSRHDDTSIVRDFNGKLRERRPLIIALATAGFLACHPHVARRRAVTLAAECAPIAASSQRFSISRKIGATASTLPASVLALPRNKRDRVRHQASLLKTALAGQKMCGPAELTH